MTKGDGGSVDTSSRTAPSRAVIEAVADAEGIPAEEVRPPTYESLHAVVDPEALDALFARRSNGAPRRGGTISFVFCEYHITIEPDGSVVLEAQAD